MPRRYMHIKEYENEILQEIEKGKTLREIGEKLGFTYKQMRDFKTRHHKNKRKVATGIAPKKRGRPPKDYVVSKQEKVTAELQLHSDQGFQYTSQAYF